MNRKKITFINALIMGIAMVLLGYIFGGTLTIMPVTVVVNTIPIEEVAKDIIGLFLSSLGAIQIILTIKYRNYFWS